MIALGSFIGTAVAYNRHRTGTSLEPFTIITRWSYVGFAAGLLYQTAKVLT